MRLRRCSYHCSDPYVVLCVGSNNRPQTSPVVCVLPFVSQCAHYAAFPSCLDVQIEDTLNPVFNWKAGPFTWNGFDPVNVRRAFFRLKRAFLACSLHNIRFACPLYEFRSFLFFSQIRLFDKDEITDESLGFVDVSLGEDDFAGNGARAAAAPDVKLRPCAM